MREFSLAAYGRLVEAMNESGYRTLAVIDWFESAGQSEEPVVVVRHDVDRRPDNALKMAQLEAVQGIRSTYYFRILPVSFQPEIVRAIADLGHEIGYHYEDLHRAGGDVVIGERLFVKALSELRELAPIETISMHGSPLASRNNMELWNHCSFTEHGVRDCLLSDSWKGFHYFTDSGRTFGTSSANLRDRLGEAETPAGIRSCIELAEYIRSRSSRRMMISTHPERWTDDSRQWLRQFTWDLAANTAKRLIRLHRSDEQ